MTRIRLLIIGLSLIIKADMMAQQPRCKTSNVDYNLLRSNYPEMYRNINDLESFTKMYVNNQISNSNRLINGDDLIVIPVVVHVLHNGEPVGAGLNISMDRIQSQIDVLNQDFRRLNTDAINTPSIFLPVASDFHIEFKLACIDPNGNPTDGVVRKQTTAQSFEYNLDADRTPNDESNGIKTSPTGSVSWNTSVSDSRYLNIWVCNLRIDAGYGTFPSYWTTYPQYDGVVITTSDFGVIPGNPSTHNKGRTATHEIGHWLNLKHLWGDDNDNLSCTKDDDCSDTPQQKQSHFSFWNQLSRFS